MFWLFFACTVGSSGPATPSSTSANEANQMAEVADKAGALSNAARELEKASAAARQRIANGASPAMEAAKLEEIMRRLESLETDIQNKNDAMIERIQQAQSTADTRE